MNRVFILGNITRDIELRTTPSNTAVAEIGLAVNRKWKDASGEAKEEVCFIDCTAWGKTAELIAQYFHKGNKILVEGRLKLDTWQDKTTNENRSKLKVVIESFHFLGAKQEAASEGGGGAGKAPGQSKGSGWGPRASAPAPTPEEDLDIPF